MAYRYVENISPRDRFQQLELQMDNGDSAILQRGRTYDLSATEVARARAFIVLEQTAAPADSNPVGIAFLPVKGNPINGQVPIWNSPEGVFEPGTVSAGGGGGMVQALIEDSISGYPARDLSFPIGIWVGPTDPTALMQDWDGQHFDIYFAVPEP